MIMITNAVIAYRLRNKRRNKQFSIEKICTLTNIDKRKYKAYEKGKARPIDEELEKLGKDRIYYPGAEPFYDGRDWGTLCQLLNEDYHDLLNRNVVDPDSAAEYLFERTVEDALIGTTAKKRVPFIKRLLPRKRKKRNKEDEPIEE